MNLGFFSVLFRYRERKSPDKLGLYPERVHIEAMPERRYLWTSRILVIIGVFSLCLTIMLAMTIYLLLPQRSARPTLYSENKFFSRLEKVEPSERSAQAMDLITEQNIEKYIKLRHEVPESQAELMYRWNTASEFYQLSAIGVYQEFIYQLNQDKINSFITAGLERKVFVQWIRPMNGTLWQAQFITSHTTDKNPEPVIGVWRAYLRIEYADITDENKEQFSLNPFGFKVRRYSLAYIGNTGDKENYLETAKRLSELK